jgi:hypothetical protein
MPFMLPIPRASSEETADEAVFGLAPERSSTGTSLSFTLEEQPEKMATNNSREKSFFIKVFV